MAIESENELREKLVHTGESLLQPYGEVIRNNSGNPYDADLLFIPPYGEQKPKVVLIDCKFSHSTTLGDALAVQSAQKLIRFKQANPELDAELEIITNGKSAVRMLERIQRDYPVQIHPEVKSDEALQAAFSEIVERQMALSPQAPAAE